MTVGFALYFKQKISIIVAFLLINSHGCNSMNKTINLIIFISCIFSTQSQASYIDFTTSANGSLGFSTSYFVDGVNVEISAYNYNTEDQSLLKGLIVGIDGVANSEHPAGLGAGKSAVSINPPGLDNTSKFQIEFLVFKFDSKVFVDQFETQGLGPHGTDVDFWGGNVLNADFAMSDLGVKYTVEDTTPAFQPDDALGAVSWFALGAKYTEHLNVFSIQRMNFTEAPAAVPVPAAFWLFATGLFGLLRVRRG